MDLSMIVCKFNNETLSEYRQRMEQTERMGNAIAAQKQSLLLKQMKRKNDERRERKN